MNLKRRSWISMAMIILVFILGSLSVYAADYPDVNAYDGTTTLKGVQGAQNYGSQHAFYNFDIRRCYIPDSYPECGLPYFEFEGKQYRFFDALDFFPWLSTQNKAGRTANVQFMISWEDSKEDPYLWQGDYPLRRILIDPAVQNKTNAYYYAPASTGEGKQIMRAFWSWFMTELSKRQLHVDNFILGNEVNAPIYWHYSGEGLWTEKVQKYAISFYDMRQIIRSFSDKPRISICLDHSWYHNDEGRGITAREYLSVFDATLTGLNGSKKVDDWCISMHLYPAVLTWPLIWTDKPGYPSNLNGASEYASFVDGKNLSYITNYIKNTYGENHRIMLTEQGFTSHLGESYQAAGLVYSYYAAKYDPMVDCFILMVADSGTELKFSIDGKMAGQIYTNIDNPTIQNYVDSNLLPVIGVSAWSQIVPNYGQTITRKTYVGSGSKYAIEASSSVAEGGSVSGAGSYEKGQKVTLTATPNDNYYFVAWKEGDDVVSTDATYVFTATKKRILVAEFQMKPWIAFEANGGGESMSGLRVELGAEYTLPECIFTAPEGMVFDCWQIGTELHQPGETITVSGDITIQAIWKTEEGELFQLAGASMNLGNSLDMLFLINKADVTETDCYATIRKVNAGKDDTVKTYQFSEWYTYGPYYLLQYDKLTAMEMNDKFYVQVFHADGTPASEIYEDSVADYALRGFEDLSEAEKRLSVDLLFYGAAAQKTFNYDVAHLVSDRMTTAQKAYATTNVSGENHREDKEYPHYAGTSLDLQSTIQFYLFFNDIPRDGHARISFTNHNGMKVESTVAGSDYLVASSTMSVIVVDELTIPDARKLVTCEVYDKSGTLLDSVTDSIESYVFRGTTGEIDEAVLKFADSAYNFFHPTN